MIKKYKYFALCFFLYGIIGCEYNLDKDYIVNITPPEENYPVAVNLNSNSDTIEVFNRTQFNFDLNTFGLNIKVARFKIEDEVFGFFYNSGTFSLSPEYFTPGYHTLSLEVITNSGTGSISDLAGGEGYKFEKQWVILVDGREAPTISSSIGISDKGFQKFTWEKCNQYNFHTTR